MLIAHNDRVIRVESCHASVLDEYTGDMVYGYRNYELVIEADTLGIRGDVPAEVGAPLRTEPKVSSVDNPGDVTCFFQHIGHSDAGDVDD